MNTNQFNKLPKYARREIDQLRSEVQRLEKKVKASEEGVESDFFYINPGQHGSDRATDVPSREVGIRYGESYTDAVTLSDLPGNNPSALVKSEFRLVYLNSGGASMKILPYSSNAAYIEIY